eukprot:scaffold23123_cov121-Isochrysis_galbana.AAC.1
MPRAGALAVERHSASSALCRLRASNRVARGRIFIPVVSSHRCCLRGHAQHLCQWPKPPLVGSSRSWRGAIVTPPRARGVRYLDTQCYSPLGLPIGVNRGSGFGVVDKLLPVGQGFGGGGRGALTVSLSGLTHISSHTQYKQYNRAKGSTHREPPEVAPLPQRQRRRAGAGARSTQARPSQDGRQRRRRANCSMLFPDRPRGRIVHYTRV